MLPGGISDGFFCKTQILLLTVNWHFQWSSLALFWKQSSFVVAMALLKWESLTFSVLWFKCCLVATVVVTLGGHLFHFSLSSWCVGVNLSDKHKSGSLLCESSHHWRATSYKYRRTTGRHLRWSWMTHGACFLFLFERAQTTSPTIHEFPMYSVIHSRQSFLFFSSEYRCQKRQLDMPVTVYWANNLL